MNDSLAPLLAEDAAEEVADRRAALDLLPLIFKSRAARNQAGKDLDKLEPPLRDFMNRHGGEDVGRQDESLYVAFFEPRSGGHYWSPLLEIYQKNRKLFMKLLNLGLLDVSDKRFQDVMGQFAPDEVASWRHEKE